MVARSAIGATILVGSERDGLPDEVVAQADHVAHIPIATDSLNAAMAATIALYELSRRHARPNDRPNRGHPGRGARRAIAARRPTRAALEDVRIQYLGRKAELPNLLRNVASLPPQERAATGKAANEARKALEAAIEQRAEQLADGGRSSGACARRPR